MKKLALVGIVLGLIMFLSACEELNLNTPQEEQLILEAYDVRLDEDDYWYNDTAIPVSQSGKLTLYFDLKHWDGDYPLDIMLMTTGDFSNYESGGTYYRQHYIASETGSYKFTFYVNPGYYVLVIDNTNKESDTDFDFENDYAIFDMELYYTPE